MGNDLPVIAPRMRRGVGYVSVTCPQNTSIKTSMSVCTCRLIGRARYVCDYTGCDLVVCPVWATRTVARLEAVEAWAERKDGPVELLTWFRERVGNTERNGWHVVAQIDAVLATYPGKDGQ